MTIKHKFTKENLFSLGTFIILGLVALQLPISGLAGSKVNFTLFDLFAPISAAFLGTPLGILAVFLMEIVNIAIHGFKVIDSGTVIRLFPILFGVWFFARRDKWSLLVPLLAIISFNLNPVGRSVWYYSLLWTIPFFVYPFTKKSLVARSLASTFIAHAAGGAVWVWAFSLPAFVWRGLIPTVILERSLMTIGICASFILVNNLVSIAKKHNLLGSKYFILDKKYLLKTFRI